MKKKPSSEVMSWAIQGKQKQGLVESRRTSLERHITVDRVGEHDDAPLESLSDVDDDGLPIDNTLREDVPRQSRTSRRKHQRRFPVLGVCLAVIVDEELVDAAAELVAERAAILLILPSSVLCSLRTGRRTPSPTSRQMRS